MELSILIYFGARFAVEREAQHMSLKSLAAEMSMSTETLKRIEAGVIDITLSQAEQLSEALGVHIADLLQIDR